MRVLILAAAATLFISGTAMAAHHHHHARAATAPAADGTVPADTLSAHDAYIRNLRDSGYNPAAANTAN